MSENINILLVEDNEGDIILTRKAFEHGKIEHKLFIARNGEEGLVYLNKAGESEDTPIPDLVLLDLNMPKMNGIEFLEQIKIDERFKSIPIVVLTTSDSEEDIAKSYNLHASSYIKKPVDFSQFVTTIKSFQEYWFNIVKLPYRV